MIADIDKGHMLSYFAVARISAVLAQLIHVKENPQIFMLETAATVILHISGNMAILKLNTIAEQIAKQIAAVNGGGLNGADSNTLPECN